MFPWVQWGRRAATASVIDLPRHAMVPTRCCACSCSRPYGAWVCCFIVSVAYKAANAILLKEKNNILQLISMTDTNNPIEQRQPSRAHPNRWSTNTSTSATSKGQAHVLSACKGRCRNDESAGKMLGPEKKGETGLVLWTC